MKVGNMKAVDEKEGGGGGESLSILIIIIFQQDLQYEVQNCCWRRRAKPDPLEKTDSGYITFSIFHLRS